MKFNEHDFSNDFIVKRVRTHLLSPRDISFFRNAFGRYYINQVKEGMTKIEVDIAMINCTKAELKAKAREIAPILKTDGLVRLETNEPGLYHEAILSGDTDLDELHGLGETTLIFLSPYNCAFSTEETVVQDVTGINEGTTETYPTITLNVTDSTSQITLINDQGDRIDLLGSFSAGDVIILYLDNPAYVTYNGVVDMTIVSLTSDLEHFPLQVGTWNISGLANADIEVKYRERYL